MTKLYIINLMTSWTHLRNRVLILVVFCCMFVAISNQVSCQTNDIVINFATSAKYTANNSIKLNPGALCTSGFAARITTDNYVEPIPSQVIDGQTGSGSETNFIFTRTFRKEVSDIEAFENNFFSNNKDVVEQVQYFDGLGRLSQTIDIKGSPDDKDIVLVSDYDQFGREIDKYLPYTSSGSDGSFKSSGLTDQGLFYSTSALTGLDKADNRAFSETVFESSPMNRVLSEQGPGTDWNGIKVSTQYGTNAAASVILWEVDANGVCNRNGYYDQNTLFKTVITDENGHQTTEYKEKTGQVVLKESGSNAKTYYVYDDLGLLRFVLPPKAVEEIGIGGLTDNIKNDWCYSYKYDTKKRMIEKKLPGADPVFMIYDKRNRVVLTQDGNLRKNTSGTELRRWMYTKYDAFNRPVVTGIYTHGSVVDPTNMAMIIENSGSSLFETRTSANYSTQFGYTTTSFPLGTTEVLSITYYDDYNFDNSTNGSAERKFFDEGLTSEANGTKKGLTTGTKTKILGENLFVDAALFYDKYGRTVQTLQIQPINASITDTLRISNEIIFTGELVKVKTTHKIGSVVQTIKDEFAIDDRGRLMEHKKTVNNEPAKIITQNNYNQLGQMVLEKMGVSSGNSLQSTDYLYNIRGWLRAINNVPETSDLFAMQLYYTQDLTDLNVGSNYNGNISAMKWTHKNLNGIWKAYGFKYDELNRLNDAIYGEYTSATAIINNGYRGAEYKGLFDEKGIAYDVNGNIEALNRRGIDNPSVSSTNFSDIDRLSYTYSGNKLTRVNDLSPDILNRGDFSEKVENATEYLYDANGNMYKDDNKGITNIQYNYLNLPEKVSFSASNDYIQYVYNAGGAKLKKIVVKGGAIIYTENYAGSFVFKTMGAATFSPTTDLKYIIAEKGRLVPIGSTFTYEYTLKDHLGNSRVVFADANGNGTIENNATEILQYSDYYPFGMLHNRTATLTDDNRLLYNGKEFQSETFNVDGNAGDELAFDWYDYGARFYDPQIGRWHSVDPMADLYESYSPYSFAFNNPIRFIDPDGRMITDAIHGVDVIGDANKSGKDPIQIEPVVVTAKRKNKAVNTVQVLLDVIGFVPVVGEVADGINGAIYAFRGDWGNAAISFAAMVPLIGDLGKVGKYAVKLGKFIDKTKGVSGVYEITTKSGKKYIGQSKDIGKRLQQHSSSARFKSDEIVDVKVTEVQGQKLDREIFEQRQINNATGGVGAQSDEVLNSRNPIGTNRAGEMSRTVSTGKTYKME